MDHQSAAARHAAAGRLTRSIAASRSAAQPSQRSQLWRSTLMSAVRSATTSKSTVSIHHSYGEFLCDRCHRSGDVVFQQRSQERARIGDPAEQLFDDEQTRLMVAAREVVSDRRLWQATQPARISTEARL